MRRHAAIIAYYAMWCCGVDAGRPVPPEVFVIFAVQRHHRTSEGAGGEGASLSHLLNPLGRRAACSSTDGAVVLYRAAHTT